MIESRPSPWRGRAIMILVVLLFSVPPVIAWMLLTEGWRPGGTVNHGELVQPPVTVSTQTWSTPEEAEVFAGRWTLLHVAAGPCGETCRALLDKTGRVRVALDKDAGRVQRLLLLPERAPDLDQAAARGARVVHAPTPTVHGLLRDGERLGLSVVDPRGFRMMRYEMPLDAAGLLEDLERLLRLSNEDIEQFQRNEATDDQ